MEPALSFDSIASHYKATRPGYPGDIYALARQVGQLDSKSRILEIGAGPGIATQELSDHLGCFVDAVEPGPSFYKMLTSQFSSNPKISIRNCSFEALDSSTRYDAIFSATAFHWTDPKVRYSRSSDLLSKDGILVLYWNNYELANRDLYERIQVVYRKHFPHFDYSVPIYEIRERKIRERQKEIVDSGLFRPVESRVFKRILSVPFNKYVDLVKTFSENVVLDASISEPFFRDISSCVEKNSPTVEVEIVTNLEIARRL